MLKKTGFTLRGSRDPVSLKLTVYKGACHAGWPPSQNGLAGTLQNFFDTLRKKCVFVDSSNGLGSNRKSIVKNGINLGLGIRSLNGSEVRFGHHVVVREVDYERRISFVASKKGWPLVQA